MYFEVDQSSVLAMATPTVVLMYDGVIFNLGKPIHLKPLQFCTRYTVKNSALYIC